MKSTQWKSKVSEYIEEKIAVLINILDHGVIKKVYL